MPVLAIIHPHEKETEKYVFKDEDLNQHMTYDKLLGFLHDKKSGNLPRYLKVEDNREEIFLNGSVHYIKGHNKLR